MGVSDEDDEIGEGEGAEGGERQRPAWKDRRGSGKGGSHKKEKGPKEEDASEASEEEEEEDEKEEEGGGDEEPREKKKRRKSEKESYRSASTMAGRHPTGTTSSRLGGTHPSSHGKACGRVEEEGKRGHGKEGEGEARKGLNIGIIVVNPANVPRVLIPARNKDFAEALFPPPPPRGSGGPSRPPPAMSSSSVGNAEKADPTSNGMKPEDEETAPPPDANAMKAIPTGEPAATSTDPPEAPLREGEEKAATEAKKASVEEATRAEIDRPFPFPPLPPPSPKEGDTFGRKMDAPKHPKPTGEEEDRRGEGETKGEEKEGERQRTKTEKEEEEEEEEKKPMETAYPPTTDPASPVELPIPLIILSPIALPRLRSFPRPFPRLACSLLLRLLPFRRPAMDFG